MNQDQAANVKPIIDLMESVKRVIKRDVALGLYEEPQLRLAIEDRKAVVAELKAQGCSNREIARVLGVDESTVRADQGAGNPADEEKKKKKNNGGHDHDAGNPAGAAAALEMPTEAEAEESHQQALYDQACLFLERMTGETRQRFFAYLRRTYDGNCK